MGISSLRKLHKNPRKLKDFPEKPRKLNHFLVQEMLYSYLSSKLDKKSKEAVEDYIKDSVEIKKEMNFILFAMSYCNELSRGKISKTFLKDIEKHQPFFQKLKTLFSWKRLPQWMQWSLEATSIAIFVAIGVGVAISFYYNEKEPHKSFYEKNKVQKEEAEESSFVIANQLSHNDTKEGLFSEKSVKNEKPSPPSSSEGKPLSSSKEEMSAYSADSSNQLNEIQKTEELTPTSSYAGGERKGYVYKVYMNLDNVQYYTPLIIKKIKQLKGKKAGRVKLGWRKSKGSYFHFSLPESNQPQLLQELKTFGAVRFQKERHKRIMPEGQIRMILWIERGSLSKNQEMKNEENLRSFKKESLKKL